MAPVIVYLEATESPSVRPAAAVETEVLPTGWRTYMHVFDMAHRGERHHPGLGGSVARVIGYVDKSADRGVGQIGPFARDEVITRMAQCFVEHCGDMDPLS